MRKIKKMMVTVVTMMAIAMSLTGCGNLFREDDKHATVSVTTSDGRHMFSRVLTVQIVQYQEKKRHYVSANLT